MQLDPVSPELVLIDPELARRERTRLEERAYLQSLHDVAALRDALESHPQPVEEAVRHRSWWPGVVAVSKRRLVPAVLLCSLLANGLFVAHVVAQKGQAATQVAVRMVTLTESAAPRPQTSGAERQESQPLGASTVSTTLLSTKAAVERKVISLILSAPTGKLPRRFVDSKTGLVKNNVQVACRLKHQRQQRSFLCAVHLPADNTRNAFYVRYRTDKNGRSAFKWFGYKHS